MILDLAIGDAKLNTYIGGVAAVFPCCGTHVPRARALQKPCENRVACVVYQPPVARTQGGRGVDHFEHVLAHGVQPREPLRERLLKLPNFARRLLNWFLFIFL